MVENTCREIEVLSLALNIWAWFLTEQGLEQRRPSLNTNQPLCQGVLGDFDGEQLFKCNPVGCSLLSSEEYLLSLQKKKKSVSRTHIG